MKYQPLGFVIEFHRHQGQSCELFATSLHEKSFFFCHVMTKILFVRAPNVLVSVILATKSCSVFQCRITATSPKDMNPRL